MAKFAITWMLAVIFVLSFVVIPLKADGDSNQSVDPETTENSDKSGSGNDTIAPKEGTKNNAPAKPKGSSVITCSTLKVPKNVTEECTDGNKLDSTCSFSCDNVNQTLSDPNPIKCVSKGEKGEWNTTAPTCGSNEGSSSKASVAVFAIAFFFMNILLS